MLSSVNFIYSSSEFYVRRKPFFLLTFTNTRRQVTNEHSHDFLEIPEAQWTHISREIHICRCHKRRRKDFTYHLEHPNSRGLLSIFALPTYQTTNYVTCLMRTFFKLPTFKTAQQLCVPYSTLAARELSSNEYFQLLLSHFSSKNTCQVDCCLLVL